MKQQTQELPNKFFNTLVITMAMHRLFMVITDSKKYLSQYKVDISQEQTDVN